jgi:hypothetical protein
MKKLILPLVILFTTVYLTNRLPSVTITTIPKSKPTPIEQFMDRVAAIETPGGTHRTVNQFGMMGRYQFSPSTVRVLGFRVSQREFLNNKQIQDTVMLRYMKVNNRELSGYINRYNGRIVNGVKITRAGVLAGAHFAGSEGVKAFFRNGSNRTDANGTSVAKYMSKFSNFHLPEI